MNGQSGKKTYFPIGGILFLAAAFFAIWELAFDWPISFKQANNKPAVSVEYRGTDIVLDSNRHYVLVSTYVFSNKGDILISFDACYECSASYNGTALQRTYRDDRTATEANDTIKPGVVIALQVGHDLDNFIPGKSAPVQVKLTERFGEMNVIHDTELEASGITVKEENPYCMGC